MGKRKGVVSLLREQRLNFFTEAYEIENSYFSESASNIVQKGIEKIRNTISSILEKIRQFFSKFSKSDKNVKVNPNVTVDKKEVGRIRKFLSKVRAIISKPIKAIVKYVSTHKKSTALIVIATFTVGVLTHRENNKRILNNTKITEEIQKQNKHIDVIADINKKIAENKKQIKELNRTCEDISNDIKDIDAKSEILEKEFYKRLCTSEDTDDIFNKMNEFTKERDNLFNKRLGLRHEQDELSSKNRTYSFDKAIREQQESSRKKYEGTVMETVNFFQMIVIIMKKILGVIMTAISALTRKDSD